MTSATVWRIFEIADDGSRSVAGWGDHASPTSAIATVRRWGSIADMRFDVEHDAFDLILRPGNGLPPTQLAIEPINDVNDWITQ